MTNPVAAVGAIIFAFLGLWHFYWALGGSIGKAAAIPEIEGCPAFSPSATVTALVGAALVTFALLLAATSGAVAAPLPDHVLSWLCYGLALALFARAVGEFKLVGFFKRVRGSRFARLDTLVYSPLCLALSVIALQVGHRGVV
ncbi:MAG: DUF3995 domain-containing protein [Sulfurimicrobium sp.]|nr:DUF3995 domain-containing protein [Sulfurimicrobium sp.]MDO9188505.1 DUF3995 domain-containing protein [Sulfurimicrobium sp.]MDP2198830.1 DUF3995 domain-containing protein [Sulfurimicrobium sp.]MDP2963949.1 DUF3995 domain-containing protein [Sulfurimicrobium sp.]MDP3687282.1 DUF3995 domain-containing protein [Sulfurimicrobium sp.]